MSNLHLKLNGFILFLLLALLAPGLQTLRVSETLRVYALQKAPGFEPAKCMFELPPGVTEGEDVVCGYVSAPLEHANPDGPAIRLAVAVLKSSDPAPRPDPLFIAQGGPGGSTIDTYAGPLLGGSPLRGSRDIVLFDQRGTLYSQPALLCTEIDQLTLDIIEKDLSNEEYLRLDVEAMRACRQRLQEQGIDLSAFDSLENAADIDVIRQALGYDKINLYGVSYGTLLALHTMRSHSEMLRSVILDGVVPPSINFIPNVPHTMNDAFEHLFADCAADASCSRAYPDLRQVFYDLVDGFNAEPVRIPLTDPDSQIIYRAVLDGDTFQGALFQMVYAGSLIPGLPRMIYDAREGRFDFLSNILSILIFDRTMSYGMYYSVLCAEDADFDPAQQDLSGLPAQIAAAEAGDAVEFLQVCQDWQVLPLAPPVDDPVVSQVPTLILSGAFDPITPASYAEEAARTLPNSFSYVFPAGGHGQMLDGGCADRMILAFLDDPHAAPDTACEEMGGMPPVRYFTPQNTISLPVVLKLLNLSGAAGRQLLALSLSLACLMSALPVYGIAWLGRRLRPKTAGGGRGAADDGRRTTDDGRRTTGEEAPENGAAPGALNGQALVGGEALPAAFLALDEAQSETFSIPAEVESEPPAIIDEAQDGAQAAPDESGGESLAVLNEMEGEAQAALQEVESRAPAVLDGEEDEARAAVDGEGGAHAVRPYRAAAPRLPRLLPILGGVLLPGFLCGVFVMLMEMALSNDNRLFFGMGREANGWFLLPWLFVFLTLGMLAAALRSWIKGSGGVWSRLYFSLLTLAALVCVFILLDWGMLAAVFY